jgi:hypothetical protein
MEAHWSEKKHDNGRYDVEDERQKKEEHFCVDIGRSTEDEEYELDSSACKESDATPEEHDDSK